MGGHWAVIGPDGKRTEVFASSEREAKMKVIFSQAHVQLHNRLERRKYAAQAKGYRVVRIK